MRIATATVVFLGFLTVAAFLSQARAEPDAKQVEQALSGLLAHDDMQDDKLREAYRRGYRQGRADEARAKPVAPPSNNSKGK
jgi:hypothetical protein